MFTAVSIVHSLLGLRPAVHRAGSNSRVRRNPTNLPVLVGLAALLLTCLCPGAYALSSADLRADQNLTPERLMKYVSGFKFEQRRELRSTDAFLRDRCGDCDDFAAMAAGVLREKGYRTRLVAVYMAREVHVVCYVAESGGYLDFNRRKEADPLVKCPETLAAIGARVAESFRTDWLSVSEYNLAGGRAEFLQTEFR